MNHLFVSREIAAIAKEKGFDESCFGRYEGDKFTTYSLTDYSTQCGYIKAPLYQQLTDWFREKHKLHILIDYYYDGSKWKYHLDFIDINSKDKIKDGFLSYKAALDEAILEAFKLI